MDRWLNQEEAFKFAMSRNSCMLDMDMGTGKTRVAIDIVFERQDVHTVLVVCPKSVIPVWRQNLEKFEYETPWDCWDKRTGTVKAKAEDLAKCMGWFKDSKCEKLFVIVNYDSVWRAELGDFIHKRANFDMIILDESHRAKSAGSKVSKYLAMVGKHTRYKLCLSGTPMANSPLDVYGQYRFLDPTIYGTNYERFKQEYAILGGPDLKFIVGFKNQKQLNEKFDSIAYHCKMADVADRLKLPPVLPPIERMVELPVMDKKIIRDLSKEFVAECQSGHIVVNNVLVSLLRIQQICSGFCLVRESVFDEGEVQELNTCKEDALIELLEDINAKESIVVFCTFRHDIDVIKRVCARSERRCYELSGAVNTLAEWQNDDSAVIAVQIQAGAEGVDMTKANYAIYYSIPHSLAQYNQSKARLYRPGQTKPVSFIHLIAEDTVDEAMYQSLLRKEDIIESIKAGTFDFGYMH